MNNDIMTLPGIYNEAKKQLAYEFNCSPDDFSKDENTITTSILHEKRRKFSEEAFFIQMATFGKGTVISADETIHSWLQEWTKGKSGIWLFEQHIFLTLKWKFESRDIKCL